MAEVAIVIPGIMSSELYDGDVCVWPGEWNELIRPYKKMKHLLKPELEVRDIIRSIHYYGLLGSLISALEACGFSEGAEKGTLMVCPYDWRKDNRVAAERLAECVKQMRARHGADVEINLIAHSMGGLVSRYLLESGDYDDANCPGFSSIRRLITIGTPHRGTPVALCAALGQIDCWYLNGTQVKELAGHEDFPSLYQLMPPLDEPFLWNTDPSARLGPVSPYEKDVAEILGLSVKNLTNAAKFHAALNIERRPPHVMYFCFVGTGQSTIANVQANFAQPQYLNPTGVESASGGDGSVPIWSSSLVGVQQLAVSGSHATLYKTSEVLRTLGALLGKEGVLCTDLKSNLVRISVHDEVVKANAAERIAISMDKPRNELDATLVLRKLVGTEAAPLANPPTLPVAPVTYKGAGIDSLSLTIICPTDPGLYEVDLVVAGLSIAENKPALIVQA
ncbi:MULTISPECIES: lipase/acyltransferase domain-containing protein [unclassified Caballeronia]|uniref:lipase/acyltransferase domain-containing protein n=1 Tax=unclassified Caballeronia TaxID=2646786 RepID=UPI00286366E2|nr:MULTISPECIES: hypothetical protein [unclassified Caballeronia]MDR5777745.1 hypothetical protein [Caballeronia sp. LZ002]MDR5800073.1 hypothetical protein [Caballeronia sp. LZ001]MDR5853172.1 hypothetical protein [Caballeronia sp. LZ003]